jgi:hypothetical protein
MKLLLAALISLSFASANLFSADAPKDDAKVVAKAENSKCCCGKDVDAKSEMVTVKDGDKTHTYAVCSKDCADHVAGLKSADAVKAFADQNKKTEGGAAK